MTDQVPRLRVFAGPNGSGKSTIIDAVRNYQVGSIPVDFGIYVNADDIAKALRNNTFSFDQYTVQTDTREFIQIASASGLLNQAFSETDFITCFTLIGNSFRLVQLERNERLAQIIADFLRKKLLQEKKKFSFETVFSHPSKLDIMKEAIQAGYKVYLYFVSTESPDINKFRVKVRMQLGGHSVPMGRIESRYYRSLDLLYDAAQLTYQTFFFDNSKDNFQLFAHFKNVKGTKTWDSIDESIVPAWFITYYSNKVKNFNKQ